MLYLALELGDSNWKLAFTVGLGQKPRVKTITARSTLGLLLEIKAAKKRFGLPEDAPVLSCYEAGRDGFWLHRFLLAHGVQNQVVDSSSIEVNRRQGVREREFRGQHTQFLTGGPAADSLPSLFG